MPACCAGKHFPSAALMCRRAGKKPVPLIKIEMEEVMVSSVATGHAERDDRPTENITLNFAKFKVTYTPTKPDGSAAAPSARWVARFPLIRSSESVLSEV